MAGAPEKDKQKRTKTKNDIYNKRSCVHQQNKVVVRYFNDDSFGVIHPMYGFGKLVHSARPGRSVRSSIPVHTHPFHFVDIKSSRGYCDSPHRPFVASPSYNITSSREHKIDIIQRSWALRFGQPHQTYSHNNK